VPKPIEVLVVEDNAGDILLIKRALAHERFPISIHVAVDGNQALQILTARQFDPDLVILDLNIPRRSGLAVLEDIQPGVPVVVFTSSSDPVDRRCSFELGVREFVQKPTNLDDYDTAVSQIVRHWVPRSSQASTLSR
jgi:CheY-like chemotaxis protein